MDAILSSSSHVLRRGAVRFICCAVVNRLNDQVTIKVVGGGLGW